MLDFLKDYDKEISKIDGVSTSSAPPQNWYSIGNYSANRAISGSFRRGVPQGRITGLVGPSGSGKSYLLGNFIKSAQEDGAYVYVIDSENALDDDFMGKIGIDTESNYKYRGVITISHVLKLVSSFLKGYDKSYAHLPIAEQPKVMIAIDSLGMLMTDTDLEAFNKGDQKGDQGQRAKQIKAMLRQFVQAIKHLNIAMVVTDQVYQATAEQKLAGEGLWVVNQAVRYSLSQIVLVTKLKLKGGEGGAINGVRMKVEGFKTRFTQPFQTVTIEVPYTEGMDPTSGLIETMEAMGVLIRGGSWYTIKGTTTKFQAKDLSKYVEQLLNIAELETDTFIKVVDDAFEEDPDQGSTAKEDRLKRLANAASGVPDGAVD